MQPDYTIKSKHPIPRLFPKRKRKTWPDIRQQPLLRPQKEKHKQTAKPDQKPEHSRYAVGYRDHPDQVL
jgi:hypothetical protein